MSGAARATCVLMGATLVVVGVAVLAPGWWGFAVYFAFVAGGLVEQGRAYLRKRESSRG